MTDNLTAKAPIEFERPFIFTKNRIILDANGRFVRYRCVLVPINKDLKMNKTPELTARALTDFANPKYRSKVEEEWSNVGTIYIQEYFGTPVLRQDYEPLAFNLPGGIKYTPDFLYILEGGAVVFVEVKISKKQKGYQRTLNKLKTAQATYPYFIFIETIKQEGWKIRRI